MKIFTKTMMIVFAMASILLSLQPAYAMPGSFNDDGSIPSVTSARLASDIAFGGMHTCAIANGSVWCWGRNWFGSLGDGTTTDRNMPVAVLQLPGPAQQVAVGDDHTCVLLADHKVMCWGANYSGQLGNATFADSATPVAVSNLENVVAIAAGWSHNCALLSDHSLKCWGDNFNGELGNGSGTDSNIPVTVLGLSSNVAAVAAGAANTCVIMSSGGAKCWGRNNGGQVGDGSYQGRDTPADVVGLTNVSAITIGNGHTCAIDAGAAKCWGFGGALGNNEDFGSTYPVPVNVSSLSESVTAIAAGGNHTCALANGTLKCWGWNDDGQLGDGTTTYRNEPGDVIGLSGSVMKIGAGSGYNGAPNTCVLLTTGLVQCWGYNEFGQVGDGTYTDRLAPVFVNGFGYFMYLPTICR